MQADIKLPKRKSHQTLLSPKHESWHRQDFHLQWKKHLCLFGISSLLNPKMINYPSLNLSWTLDIGEHLEGACLAGLLFSGSDSIKPVISDNSWPDIFKIIRKIFLCCAQKYAHFGCIISKLRYPSFMRPYFPRKLCFYGVFPRGLDCSMKRSLWISHQ